MAKTSSAKNIEGCFNDSRDCISHELGDKARVVLECCYVKDNVYKPGPRIVYDENYCRSICMHPDVDYGRGVAEKGREYGFCVVIEMLLKKERLKNIGEFVCPLNKEVMLSPGINARQIKKI